jgi:hypothetical protein
LVIPDLIRGSDGPFDRLTVLSDVEGLTTLSTVEGESRNPKCRLIGWSGFQPRSARLRLNGSRLETAPAVHQSINQKREIRKIADLPYSDRA